MLNIDLDFEYIYKELDIKITDRGESFYQNRMLAVVQELQSKSKKKQKILLKNPIPFVLKIDLLKLEEGRQVMFLPGIDVPMTIVKTDGSFTYDTSDMATIKQRLYEENADWVIYVIDSGQVMDFIKRIYRIFI